MSDENNSNTNGEQLPVTVTDLKAERAGLYEQQETAPDEASRKSLQAEIDAINGQLKPSADEVVTEDAATREESAVLDPTLNEAGEFDIDATVAMMAEVDPEGARELEQRIGAENVRHVIDDARSYSHYMLQRFGNSSSAILEHLIARAAGTDKPYSDREIAISRQLIAQNPDARSFLLEKRFANDPTTIEQSATFWRELSAAEQRKGQRTMTTQQAPQGAVVDKVALRAEAARLLDEQAAAVDPSTKQVIQRRLDAVHRRMTENPDGPTVGHAGRIV